jgi:hypothetical protein
MIDLLGIGIGAGVASVAWFLFLLWCCQHAWWLGVKDYKRRKYSACDFPCWECDGWRKCLHQITTIDPDEEQHKDELNEPWVRSWKRKVKESD